MHLPTTILILTPLISLATCCLYDDDYNVYSHGALAEAEAFEDDFDLLARDADPYDGSYNTFDIYSREPEPELEDIYQYLSTRAALPDIDIEDFYNYISTRDAKGSGHGSGHGSSGHGSSSGGGKSGKTGKSGKFGKMTMDALRKMPKSKGMMKGAVKKAKDNVKDIDPCKTCGDNKEGLCAQC